MAADDESLFTGEPAQRIERIQDELSNVDDKFQPAGSIGPEVELVFSNAEANPFDERFDEEELVVDRFAARAADPLSRAPIVRSAEGAEISARLSSHAKRKKQAGKSPIAAANTPTAPRQPTAPIKPGAEPATNRPAEPPRQSAPNTSPAAIRPTAIMPIIAPITAPIDRPAIGSAIEFGLLADTDRPAMPVNEDVWPNAPAEALPGGMVQVGTGWIHPSEDPVMPEERVVDSADVQSFEVGDVDVIVVEDDPVPTPPPTASAVRRQEYRQLFAKLRRS